MKRCLTKLNQTDKKSVICSFDDRGKSKEMSLKKTKKLKFKIKSHILNVLFTIKEKH